ncbi:hypothetical protein BY998_14711 [Methylobacterium sp. B4]|nr:hypothetical protein BY998_14711 [Methylobacterium sp. B4]
MSLLDAMGNFPTVLRVDAFKKDGDRDTGRGTTLLNAE